MPTVNKKRLASLIGCSVPTVSALMERHPDFPVQERGSKSSSYAFDAAAVVAFLRGKEEERRAAGNERDELLDQLKLPEAVASSGLSPTDRLAMVRVLALERREMEARRELVRTAEVASIVVGALATFRREMEAAIGQALREANVPVAAMRSIQTRIADAQRTVVAKLAEQLRSKDEGAPEAAASGGTRK